MKYTESHEWVALEGNVATVGVTDHAQKELGDIVYVELPDVGSALGQGEEVCVLESTKAAADVYAPVSGKIVEVNETLRDAPEQVNQAAESSGWLYKIEMKDLSECDALLEREAYEKLVT